MNRLLEQRLEGWEYCLCQELVQLDKRGNKRSTSCWPFLVEGYIKGEVWLEVLFSARWPRVAEAKDYVAVIYRAEREFLKSCGRLPHITPGRETIIGDRANDEDLLVLVPDRELVQDVEKGVSVIG